MGRCAVKMEKIEFQSAYINPYAPPALGGAGPQSSVSVEYEVYGQVQGNICLSWSHSWKYCNIFVYFLLFSQGCNFPRYLKEVCDMRGLGGWVKNSKSGTIMGKLQGPRNRVDEV